MWQASDVNVDRDSTDDKILVGMVKAEIQELNLSLAGPRTAGVLSVSSLIETSNERYLQLQE